jgi:hypothetical protein
VIPPFSAPFWFAQLSISKTLILDCCSSAGINRGEADYVARQILDPPPLSANCDKDIWSRETGTRGVGIAEGFSGKFHASHVLLAACGRDQSAWEDPKSGQGLFTQSLLKLLGRRDVESLTYTSLMHNLKMPVWFVFPSYQTNLSIN